MAENERNTRVRAGQIRSIYPNDLEATNSPTDLYIPKYDHATQKFTWVEQSGGTGGSGGSYYESFITNDLASADTIDISHNLNVTYPSVTVYDNNGEYALPTDIIYVNANTIRLDFSGGQAPLTGTWHVRVIGGSGGTTIGHFTETFTSIDLSSGDILTVDHNFGVEQVQVTIYDNNKKQVEPSEIVLVDENSLYIDLSTLTVTGTWTVVALAGSGTTLNPTEIRDEDNDTAVRTEKNSDEDLIRFEIAGTEEMQLDNSALFPSTDEGLDLGKTTNKFNTLYLKSTSLYLGTDKLSTAGAKLYLNDELIEGDVTRVEFDKAESNIILNTFRIQVQNSLTLQNMIDGIVDEYEDESSVDNATSTNESYDSTNDYYHPTGGGDIKLLMHNNGTDASTTFVDNSNSEHVITANGNAQIDTAQKKFGTGSALFDGSGDYLSIPDSSDFDIANSNSDDWTISYFVRFNSVSVERDSISVRQDGTHEWYIQHATNNVIRFRLKVNDVQEVLLNSTTTVSTGTWYHIAICKKGSSWGLYIDGTQEAYDTYTGTYNYTGTLYIGQSGASSRYFDGWIDEILISNSDEFSASPNVGLTDTITVPTSEFTITTLNMTLVSNSFIAESQPESARVVLLNEEVDTLTLNTDLKAWASMDDGVTWAQGTLADEGYYDSSKKILTASFDLTASGIGTGTDMKYKLTTHNNKDLKVHGTSLSWD